MTQTSALIATLKRSLRAQGVTYAQVAEALELSEASVKRLFSEQQLSLSRLETICQLLGLEFIDLVQLMAQQQPKVSQLSVSQEREIAGDIERLLVTICVLNHWRLEDITQHYDIDKPKVIKHLIKLEQLELIELLPGNHIKLRVAGNFHWQTNGPIQQLFREKVEREFFSSHFDQDTEQLIVLNGMLTERLNLRFQKKMAELASEFNQLCEQDQSLPIDKKSGNTVVIALRQWQYSLFKSLHKQ